MFIDDTAEVRLLGLFLDHPDLMLKTPISLFGSRGKLFVAMKSSYEKYGILTYEGIVNFYSNSDVLAELEASRSLSGDYLSRYRALVDLLADLSIRRSLVDVSNKILTSVSDKSRRMDYRTASSILSIDTVVNEEDSSVTAGVPIFVRDLEQKRSGNYRFVDTGIPYLSKFIGGEYPRGGLTIVSAQSGGGKTALVCDSMIKMALNHELPTLFFSLEMSKARIINRFVANISGVDSTKILNGNLNDSEFNRVNEALQKVQSLPIFVVDSPNMDIDTIEYMVKRHVSEHGIVAFFVDYLQILPIGIQESIKGEGLGNLAYRIRKIAVENDVSSIVLSQVNRQGDGLDALFGSGRIGHISDLVIQLSQESDAPLDRGSLKDIRIDVFKSRNGPTGVFFGKFNGSTMTFE